MTIYTISEETKSIKNETVSSTIEENVLLKIYIYAQ